jgi:hypothetical protein
VAGVSRLISRAGDAGRACASAYRQGGVREVHRLVSNAAYWRFHPRVRRWTAQLPIQEKIDDEFDRVFGVDTAGEVPLSEVGVRASDIERGHGRYRPVWTHVLREAVERVPGKLDRFTFVDYGSGKGKAMLLASDYPFEEIIGIEFAGPLHQIATQNIEKYSNAAQRCHKIRSECVDALVFVPPRRPLVCFLFNPFDNTTMAAVLDRLRDSARQHPRDVYVVYTNMRDVGEHERFFRVRRELSRVARHPLYLIFKVSAS